MSCGIGNYRIFTIFQLLLPMKIIDMCILGVKAMHGCHLDLLDLPLFRNVSAADVDRFIDFTGASIAQVSKGKCIMEVYEESRNIGVLVEGEAQVLSEDCFGNENVSHNLGRGDMLVSTAAFMPQCNNEMAIIALTAVRVLWIPYEALMMSGKKLGQTHGRIMKNILEALYRKNILMGQKINILSQKRLRERLKLYLIYRQQRQGNAKVQVPGRTKMAQELECNRSALTREIRVMEYEGMLKTGDGWIELKEDTAAAIG